MIQNDSRSFRNSERISDWKWWKIQTDSVISKWFGIIHRSSTIQWGETIQWSQNDSVIQNDSRFEMYKMNWCCSSKQHQKRKFKFQDFSLNSNNGEYLFTLYDSAARALHTQTFINPTGVRFIFSRSSACTDLYDWRIREEPRKSENRTVSLKQCTRIRSV